MILRRISEGIRRQDWATVFVEFVLIFASVILALQFDNWNTDRLEKNKEREILEAFVEDLEENIRSFDQNILWDRNSIAACDVVLDVLNSGGEWSTEVALAMGNCSGWTSPYMKSFAYQSLKAVGVDLISNKQLRRTISELYESQYQQLVGDTDRTFWEYQHTVMLPTFAKYLVIPPHGEDLGWLERPLFPQNNEPLSGSMEFQTVVLGKRSHQSLSIRDQLKARNLTKSVLQSIKAELNQ